MGWAQGSLGWAEDQGHGAGISGWSGMSGECNKKIYYFQHNVLHFGSPENHKEHWSHRSGRKGLPGVECKGVESPDFPISVLLTGLLINSQVFQKLKYIVCIFELNVRAR